MPPEKKTIKQVCQCKNCGNEAEMEVTCSLPEADTSREPTRKDSGSAHPHRVKGSATCSHCGNEAEMWVDLP